MVNLNYIFECDWLIKLSDNKLSNNKLSDNNLASELEENRTFLTNCKRGNCNFYDYSSYSSPLDFFSPILKGLKWSRDEIVFIRGGPLSALIVYH